MLGRHVHDKVRLFVLTIFVVDDLAALLVIAVVYSEPINGLPLALAVVVFALLLVVARTMRRRSVYFAIGLTLWLALEASGVDPVVAGLVIGLSAPAYTPSRDALELLGNGLVHLAGVHLSKAGARKGNADQVQRALGDGYGLIHVARWEEGVAAASGQHARSLRQVTRSAGRWIGRENGSGARQCLDELLAGRPAPRLRQTSAGLLRSARRLCRSVPGPRAAVRTS